ncbi:hypothetical protein T484DRAFT_1769826, partial [Baffinella frigidus]
PSARRALVERFNAAPPGRCPVLLASTRTGGLGGDPDVDAVVHVDQEWHPDVVRDVRARVKRLGQARDLTVYRIVTENSVEDRMLDKTTSPEAEIRWDPREHFASAAPAENEDSNPLAHLHQASAAPAAPKAGAAGAAARALDSRDWALASAAAEAPRDCAALAGAMREGREGLPAGSSGRSRASKLLPEGTGDAAEVGGMEGELGGVQRYALRFVEEEAAAAGLAQAPRAAVGVTGKRRRVEGWREESEPLFYEVSGASLNPVSGASLTVYRELVTRLQSGFDRADPALDFNGFYEPPHPEDDKYQYIYEPMYQEAGMRAAGSDP